MVGKGRRRRTIAVKALAIIYKSGVIHGSLGITRCYFFVVVEVWYRDLQDFHFLARGGRGKQQDGNVRLQVSHTEKTKTALLESELFCILSRDKKQKKRH